MMRDASFRFFSRAMIWLRNPLARDEYFVPGWGFDLDPYIRRGNHAAVHHLIRYQWAISVLGDRPDTVNVLDIACGEGYGSKMISERFPDKRVTGADYDRGAVKRAGKRYCAANLTFVCGDALDWNATIGDAQFDCVISFDTLEHVEHREIMMEHLVRHLAPDGILLLSTPCAKEVNSLKPEWRFHKIEYSSGSLFDFLSRYFSRIYRPEDADFPHREVFDQLRGTPVNYALRMNPVVCEKPLRIVNPYESESDQGPGSC